MERFEAYQEALKILNTLLEHAQMDHAPNGEDAYAIAEFLTTLIYHLELLSRRFTRSFNRNVLYLIQRQITE